MKLLVWSIPKVFDAPAPETYEYLCTFPEHYALMKGSFIVE